MKKRLVLSQRLYYGDSHDARESKELVLGYNVRISIIRHIHTHTQTHTHTHTYIHTHTHVAFVWKTRWLVRNFGIRYDWIIGQGWARTRKSAAEFEFSRSFLYLTFISFFFPFLPFYVSYFIWSGLISLSICLFAYNKIVFAI